MLKQKILLIGIMGILVGALAACNKTEPLPTIPTQPIIDSTYTTEPEEPIIHGENEEYMTQIQFLDENVLVNGIAATADPASVYVKYNDSHTYQIVHITTAGDYEISGQLSNGQILIDLGELAQKDEAAIVNLYLNDVTIANNISSCIVFQNVFSSTEAKECGSNLYITSGSTNNIVCTAANEECDSAISAQGNLHIDNYLGKSGILNITSTQKGIDAKQNINIEGGNINIMSQSEGVSATAKTASTVTINDGFVNIKNQDGNSIDSSGWIIINGGKIIAESSKEFGLKAAEKIRINGGMIQATGMRLESDIESYTLFSVFEFEEICNRGTYTLQSVSGNTVFACFVDTDFSCMLVSGELLCTGEYYLSGSFGAKYMAKQANEKNFSETFQIEENNNYFTLKKA